MSKRKDFVSGTMDFVSLLGFCVDEKERTLCPGEDFVSGFVFLCPREKTLCPGERTLCPGKDFVSRRRILCSGKGLCALFER